MNEEKIIEMLLKHDNDIEHIKENMSTKEDVRGINDTLDKIVQLVQKKDQESTLQSYRLKEVTDVLEKHGRDIERIKEKAGIQ